MNAACINQQGTRVTAQLFQNICGAVNNQAFHIAVEHIVLPHRDRGKSVSRAHLRRRQNDAAQTALRTDKNLVAFGDQHPHMDDIPRTARRGGILHTGRERRRERNLRDGAARARILHCAQINHCFPLLLQKRLPAPVRPASRIPAPYRCPGTAPAPSFPSRRPAVPVR